MAKKRTSLEALLSRSKTDESAPVEDKKPEKMPARSPTEQSPTAQAKAKTIKPKPDEAAVFKSEIVKQTVYLPAGVHEQLRLLAFEERRKMHDYLVEGLDRVFKDRGLKPFDELTDSKK